MRAELSVYVSHPFGALGVAVYVNNDAGGEQREAHGDGFNACKESNAAAPV